MDAIQKNLRKDSDFNLWIVRCGVVNRASFAWVARNRQNIGLKHLHVFANACGPFAEFLSYCITVFIALFLVQDCDASGCPARCNDDSTFHCGVHDYLLDVDQVGGSGGPFGRPFAQIRIFLWPMLCSALQKSGQFGRFQPDDSAGSVLHRFQGKAWSAPGSNPRLFVLGLPLKGTKHVGLGHRP